MTSDLNRWEDNPEDGTTLGPEEALEKEIAKSKALKVERLKMYDKIEKLQGKNRHLLKENRELKEKLNGVKIQSTQKTNSITKNLKKHKSVNPSAIWHKPLYLLVMFTLLIGLLYSFISI